MDDYNLILSSMKKKIVYYIISIILHVYNTWYISVFNIDAISNPLSDVGWVCGFPDSESFTLDN